ncbi:hypothetical protein E7T09_08100 [Deinococcus sp. KSM4-11]|uniref:hypothetical protein n=1 Tax=Deinococcus sp. KSM4-11 TaxID=2568654 RepID=UPI0010A57767|nr:hypothetical protein [Deinococcus sp. KSM4-11]THF87117.1 hypothetical protein E7T09_08100 [Deinococcus sp. KSM4-11]
MPKLVLIVQGLIVTGEQADLNREDLSGLLLRPDGGGMDAIVLEHVMIEGPGLTKSCPMLVIPRAEIGAVGTPATMADTALSPSEHLATLRRAFDRRR